MTTHNFRQLGLIGIYLGLWPTCKFQGHIMKGVRHVVVWDVQGAPQVLPHLWNECDVMLIGPSRAGKTPLSFYLAQRGYKAGNDRILKKSGRILREVKREACMLCQLRSFWCLACDSLSLVTASHSTSNFRWQTILWCQRRSHRRTAFPFWCPWPGKITGLFWIVLTIV